LQVLDKDASSFRGERVKRHREAVLAQKGVDFEEIKITSLFAGMDFNRRSVVVVCNLSEHVAHIPLALHRIQNKVMAKLHYIGIGVDEKVTTFSQQLLENQFLEEWLAGTLPLPNGHKFQKDVTPLTQAELALITDSEFVRNLQKMELQVCHLVGAKCIIDPGQEASWLGAAENYHDEYLQIKALFASL
jgi:hypothetical protein